MQQLLHLGRPLHDVPNGEVWPLETVKEISELIESL